MYKNSLGLKLSSKLPAIALMAVGSLLIFGIFQPMNSQAAAGINQQLNFQGRLLDNTGAVVADGTYNMEFKVYQDGTGCVSSGSAPCGGTLKWTEDWIQTNRVTVKNGYFSANLNSICASWTGACASNGGIDWNQDTLWLSSNIGGTANTPTPTWDGEMTPFKRISASPYALNSNSLQGLQATSFVQLSQGIQADTSTTNPSIFINKNNSSGTPNILQLQKSGSDVLVVGNGGSLAITPTDTAATISLGTTAQTGTITLGQYNGASTSIINIGANAGASSTQQVNIGSSVLGVNTVTIGSANSTSTTTLKAGTGGINLNPSGSTNTGVTVAPANNSTAAFRIQSASAVDTLFTADTAANKLVVGNATGTNTATTQLVMDSATADPATGFNGAMYYNSTNNKFRCYQNNAWTDCGGSTANSTASLVSGVQNVTASQTSLAVETLVFTAATTVSNVAGATGFIAPAGGSFRTCLIKNQPTPVTAGILSLRWRVNGVSAGSAACTMNTTNNRSSATFLDPGVVTFSAGDTIGIAFDTNAAYAPATLDYTVFWTVDYNSTATSPSGATLQSAYDNNPDLTTTDTHDLTINLADTATDPNVLFDLQCVTSCGANGRFAIQNNGVDVFGIAPNSGNISLAPAGAGSTVVSTDGDSNFQVNYTSASDATLDIAHINIVDNASANTGSLYGLAVVNNDNGANIGVPDALAYLKNANAAETLPDGLLVEQTGAGTLTSGLEVKQTAGAVTNGLTFTGTFTRLINSTNFNVTGAGAGTFASTLTVNGTTFSLGNGSASTINTPSGNAGLSIIPNGSGALNLATTNTGNVAVGNSTGTFSLTSNGGLNITTGGALTGVASLNTINTSATALTFAGTGMVSSGTGSDVALTNQIALRPGVDASNGLTIQNASATATIASFGTNSSGGTNLIANSSVEANANGWAKKGNVAATATSSDDFAQYGSRSLKIVTTATAADGASYSVPLKASTQYTLSAWIRISTGTATTINLNRQDNSADVDAGTGNCTAISITTTFTQFACTFTTGASVNGTTNVYIKQTDAPVGGRTIYVDGVTLIAGASGLTYDAGGSGFNLQTSNSSLTLNGTDSGDVQPWQVSPTPLTTALRYGDGVQANGYIYYVGGCTGACGAGTSVATVYYAKMNADGSMGAWSAATSIPAARYGLTTYASNGYLYAVGGDSGAGVFGANPQTSVYYSKLNSDGTVGTWQTSVNVLPAAREFPSAINMNGFAYVIGGDNAGAQSTAYYAKMYADGSTSAWSATTALTTGAAARRYATTITANGFIYVIGGDTGGTAQSTVYYNTVNGDGTLGTTWASTTALSVGGAQPRRYLTSVVANGYVYAIGGDNGTAAQSTVYYAKLLPDGTLGTWQTASNPLPAGRYGADSVIVNGYIYEIGGYNGTAAQATPYYASTARILIGGSLDLVGLGGGTISASAGAGSITAGNIRAVGGLTVDGAGDFNNGLSVDSIINLNAVSANTGQTVLNVNNSSTNSIFSIRHMNSTFGSLATGGAFIGNMAYMGQEFNKDDRSAALASATATAVGDDLEWFWKASAVGVTYQTPRSVNGIAVMNFPTTTTTSGFLAQGSVAGTLNNTLLAANLPVIQIKMATTLNSASSDIYWGAENGTTAAPTANDTPPTDGFFFWNANAAGGWQGMVRSTAGGTIGTVTCPGAISVTANHYATGRIEVLDATHVHFMIDNDSTDGVNFIDCGTVTGTLPTAQLAPFIEDNQSGAQGATHVVNIDYARVWQDDSVTPEDNGLTAVTPQDSLAAADTPTINDSSADTDQTAPLTNNSPEPDAVTTLINFAAASSDDTLFSHDVYVTGTLYANKIVANQIEGMDVITDKIKSLSDELAKQQTASSSTTKTGLSGAGSGKVSFTTASIVNLTVLAQIETKGGLIVDGDAQFNGKTLFQLAAEFNGPANFNGQVTYNSDAGGMAIIKGGDQKVTVKFSKEYTGKPVIIASWLLNDTRDSQGNVDSSDAKQQRLVDGGYSYSVANVTTKSFDIVLNKKAGEDVELSWIAHAVKNAQISQSSSL